MLLNKRFTTSLACVSFVALMVAIVPEAVAGTPSASFFVTEETYDLSVPGSILVYKNEVSQGGLDLASGKMTTDAATADIAFDNGGGTLGARGVLDLGTVDFTAVHSLPDYTYASEVSVAEGHVYLVQTHDPEYPILLVRGAGGETWKFGASSPKTGGGKILLWDGNVWEIGF